MRKIIVLFICVSLFSINTYADTTSDLVAVYNNSVKVPTTEEISQFNKELNEYNKLLMKEKRIEEFNAATDDAISYQQSLVFEAQQQVTELLNQSREDANYISENIYGDFKELTKRDSRFKKSTEVAELTLDKVNKYNIPYKMESTGIDIEAKSEELERKREELETPEVEKTDYEFELGDVFKIKNIVGVPYQVSTGWGSGLDPITRTTIVYHNGIDILCPTGTEVKAMFNGEVLEAGDNWALGNYIRIKHGNGIVSIYGHLSSLNVKTGDVVSQYQLIGYSGSSGNKISQPKVFIGLFIQGRSVDPDIILKNGAWDEEN